METKEVKVDVMMESQEDKKKRGYSKEGRYWLVHLAIQEQCSCECEEAERKRSEKEGGCSMGDAGAGAGVKIDVFWDEGMLEHDTGIGVFHTGMKVGFLEVLDKHPENSDRVRNMVSILKKGPIAPYISWNSGRSALISELLSFHTPVSLEADKENPHLRNSERS
ncbi:uncharacterized protein LOC106753134 [Vigna radiata var. radiata]|uniref:Uncharacterized protein LOC106753134 n=1 Tax=Vigna radiata var. radiata TaxID=3916 RepID=A0A3Q0EN95_VIGRR|nr:uncharacterized protein LOC106753134 [Vigna radiata var. radiata]